MDLLVEASAFWDRTRENKDSVTFSDLVNDNFLIANLPPCMEIILICLFSLHVSLLSAVLHFLLPSSSHTLVSRNQHIVSVPTRPIRIMTYQSCDDEGQ
jgi:hypothetical protein